MSIWPHLVLGLLVTLGAAATEIPLQAPLTTVIPCTGPLPLRVGGITATIRLPAACPDQVGVGAFVIDGDGTWYQTVAANVLLPGSQVISLPFDDRMHGPDHQGRWSPDLAIRQAGIFLYSTGHRLPAVHLEALTALPADEPAEPPPRLTDLDGGGLDDQGVCHGQAGQTWSLRFRHGFRPTAQLTSAFQAVLTAPDGTHRTLSAFLHQPMRLQDDHGITAAHPDLPARYEIRFIPDQPGTWTIRLQATQDASKVEWQRADARVFPATREPAFKATAAGSWPHLDLSLHVAPGQPPSPPPDLAEATPSWSLGLHFPASAGSTGSGEPCLPAHLALVRNQSRATRRAVPVWLNALGPPPWRFHHAAAARLDALLDTLAAEHLAIEPVLALPADNEALDLVSNGLIAHLLSRWGTHPAVAGWRVQAAEAVPWSQIPSLQDRQLRLEALWRTYAPGQPLRCSWLTRTTQGSLRRLSFTSAQPPPELHSPTTIRLRTPLATVIPAQTDPILPRDLGGVSAFPAERQDPGEVATISVDLEVPADGPDDLGIGAYVCGRHGDWFQMVRPDPLPPGRHHLVFDFRQATPVAEPDRSLWSAGRSRTYARNGIFCWSASGQPVSLQVGKVVVTRQTDASSTQKTRPHLTDLDPDAFVAASQTCTGRTGQRWELRCRIQPAPANPYDSTRTALGLRVTRPDGVVEQVSGFWYEPQELRERGDTESACSRAPGRMVIRYRPRLAGRHLLRLSLDLGQTPLTCDLPALEVSGPTWDDYARIDQTDGRFFSTGRLTGTETFLWPIGLNIRSVNDQRGRDRNGTRLTPPREFLAYAAYLRRLAAAGGTAAEVWLSPWNLALEWIDYRPGYQGLHRYNQIHAERLDRLLDLAWSLGLRINLVIDNHGKGSASCDREWDFSPWNRAHGGPLQQPGQLATDQRALQGQDQIRRYLIARYADHPAILGWKLWSEVNLTALSGPNCASWHQQAAKRWQALDIYDHPTTTHWAGDYRNPDRTVCALPELDYLCIDAYHRLANTPNQTLADLLWDGLNGPNHLGVFSKPLLITEYGGDSSSCPQPQLTAEHASAGWIGLVSGYAGCPLLWWHEWVDQGERWKPYAALSRFLTGEDLRSSKAQAYQPQALSSSGTLWSGAWLRPGRILGYLLDRAWVWNGNGQAEYADALLLIGEQVQPGPVEIEWWDADQGQIIHRQHLTHTGGRLELRAPRFKRHLAFKLLRR